METITKLEYLTASTNDALLTIGNFDGIHIGHQKLIEAAKSLANEKGLSLALLTFEPHPRRLFRPDDPPFRITPTTLKASLLEKFGIDHLISLNFDWDFASQDADVFVRKTILEGIQPNHIMVGTDFCFGQLRKGTTQTLVDAGLDITILEKFEDDSGLTYSSSAVRSALTQGDIALANNLLGWEWEVQGIIVEGDKRGRELGFPTANVHLDKTIHPGYGVYASMVQIEGEQQWRSAATNIGIRPMFEVAIGQVEAHILDFDEDIYGKILRVKPVQRLRGEAKFDNLEELISQIEKDCDKTRKILGKI